MPSPKRRLILTVPPELDAVIDRVSKAFDKPRASVVVDLLQEMRPQLLDLAKMAEHTKANRRTAAKTVLRHMVGNAFADLMIEMQPELFEKKRK